MSEENKELTIEEAFQELELILNKLEDNQTSLEESFEVYKKGMDLLKICNGKIDKVEKKMKILHENGQLEDFQ